MKRHIRLRGLNGAIKGQSWEASDLLRVGRLDPLEVVLNDNSVSRYHAEVRSTDRGWRLRDLGSTNGTRLNGVRLGTGQWPIQERDLLQFGEVALVVEAIFEEQEPETGNDNLQIEATSMTSWDEAIQKVAFDRNRCPRGGEVVQALVRAGHHLGNLEREEDLLQSILNDAVSVLEAQRGAIVLQDEISGHLKLRSVVSGKSTPAVSLTGSHPDTSSRYNYSKSLAQRSFEQAESILCHRVDDDPELAMQQSIAEGAMGSVLCVLLRTPRRKLGVLHLDRSPWQRPFTQDELHLADALAANVSAGIESAALFSKQRELFLSTITILAQAVELRDEYTGGHTHRVTQYSMLLAEQLGLGEEDLELIRTGTPLHDIGKIGIDDSILRKPGPLTREEFEVMKTHTVKGAEIVRTIPDLHPLIPIIRSHHERWDGNGYPDALTGEDISPLARIVALADAFDAMTSDRPYRKGMPLDVAFSEIEKGAGKQFDPQFAAAFLSLREHIVMEMRNQEEAARTTAVPRTIQLVRQPEQTKSDLSMASSHH